MYSEPRAARNNNMPAKSEKQRRYLAMDLARAREGKKTRTGMSASQLEDFAKKPIQKKKR